MMNIKRTIPPWRLLVAIPMVLVVFLFSARYLRQSSVDREFEDQVASLQHSGSPVDVDSLLKRLRETTNDDQTVAWIEWMNIAFEFGQAAFSAAVLEYEDVELVFVNASPDNPWPENPVLNALLEQSEPAYKRLQELSRHEDTAWLPVLSEASAIGQAPLGMVWQIHSFMLPQMMKAVYEGDPEAASEAFVTHAAALNAFDWQTSIRVEGQLTEMLEQRDKIILEAIDQNLFSAEQLDRLKQLVGQQPDIRERWRNVIAAERAVLLERLSEDSDLLRESPVPLTYLKVYLMNLEHVMNAADDGIEGLPQRANAAILGLGTSAESELLNGVVRRWSDASPGITPDVEGFSRSLVRREASRKQVMEAIENSSPKSSSPQTTQSHDVKSTLNE